MELERLERFNPWWRTGRVNPELAPAYHRRLYNELQENVERRQAVLLWGLRRVGKTTMLLQLIDSLLAGRAPPRSILYFSFDESPAGLEDVLGSYQKLVLGEIFDDLDRRVYVFLDEVQKAEDWEAKVKVLYDLYPKVKLFLSGSASVSPKKGSSESLAGRVVSLLLDPLSFSEFLELSGRDVREISARPDIWKRELMPLFQRYMRYGTFPELVKEDEGFARKYLLGDLVERLVYRDIPSAFGTRDPELLRTLVELVGRNPGMILNYRELSKSLGRDQRTISSYVDYLRYSLIIRLVFNYRGSAIASARKLKKAYLSTPNFAFAYGEAPRTHAGMLENTVLATTDAKYFYRDGFEVDFVLGDGDGLTAVEVKKAGGGWKQLKKFRRKFGAKARRLVLVTEEGEVEGAQEGIVSVPAWMLALIGIEALGGSKEKSATRRAKA